MEMRKRQWLLGCLAFLSLLLVLCFYFPSRNDGSATLLLPENGTLPNLRLPKGEIIAGWEKDDIVYFFIPSYAALDKVSLETGLKWAEASDDILQYDVIRDLLLYPDDGTEPIPQKVCFKHSANLYTIYMDLEGNTPDAITKESFIEAKVTVLSPDGNTDCHAAAGLIKGRGNSTWQREKKPYFLKLSKEASLCGMEPGKKWILLANAYEATKLSNKLLFDFSQSIGLRYSVDSNWADLYINGIYLGNYLVCEKIDVGEHLVNITDLEKENRKTYKSCEPYDEGSLKGFVTDQSPKNISGGYIIEKDISIEDSPCGFITDGQKRFVITSPDNASMEEVTYIRDCFQNIEDLMLLQDERLLQYIDADSFARRYLIEELALNSDAFMTSCYYYKERNDDKVYAGPVWDYDAVLGESGVMEYDPIENIWLNYDEATVLSMDTYRNVGGILGWEEKFQEIPAYRNTVEKAYQDLQPQLKKLLFEQIDAAAAHVRQSVILDSIRWNYAESGTGHYFSFDNNVRYMKFFLAKRINFLNRKFGMEEWIYEDTDNTLHEITCIDETGETRLSVRDGSLLKAGDLPKYDEEKYVGWMYERDRTSVSEYLPVYEDMTLVPNPPPGTE